MKSDLSAFVDDVVARSAIARSQLARDPVVGKYVDESLPIPRPFCCSTTGQIRLIVIGQDPTVQNATSRRKIKTVLNLDKNGGLRTFLIDLCRRLGLTLDEDVYATNACKNFFVRLPTAITEANVLSLSTPMWLPILRSEVERFPAAAIISLGQPVLAMLTQPAAYHEMKYYWGYDRHWKSGVRQPMQYIPVEHSAIGRPIFPYIHQPSLRGARTVFYRERMAEYIEFIRHHSGLGEASHQKRGITPSHQKKGTVS